MNLLNLLQIIKLKSKNAYYRTKFDGKATANSKDHNSNKISANLCRLVLSYFYNFQIIGSDNPHEQLHSRRRGEHRLQGHFNFKKYYYARNFRKDLRYDIILYFMCIYFCITYD